MRHMMLLTFRRRPLLLGVFLFLPFAGVLSGQDYRRFQVQTGDDPAYLHAFPAGDAAPTYRAWRGQAEGRRYKGNLWLRGTVTFDAKEAGENRAVAIMALAAAEVYLDGELIARNGVVAADAAGEQPGRTIFVAPVPAHLDTPGPHQLVLRFSNHHGDYHFLFLAIGFGEINRMIAQLRRILLPLVLLSAFFTAALYFVLVYWFSFREFANLLFAATAMLVGALFLVELWARVGYPYHYHALRLTVTVWLAAGVNLFLPAYFAVFHGLSKRWWPLLPVLMVAAAALSAGHHDALSRAFYWTGLSCSLAVTAWALWLGRAYAAWGFVGCCVNLATLAATGYDFLEGPFFYCFLLLMVLVMVALGRRMRDTRHRAHQAQLTSARLQTELLQKHLQPHFMMNTLTAAMEWVERNPAEAVRFIEALAGEMRALFAVSGKNLIPLRDELAMCRAHLTTQSYRTGRQHDLTVTGPIEAVHIPPAVILTLVENGLTHGLPDRPHFFHLTVGADGRRFSFEVDQQEIGEIEREGTGTRYIKARLEESYPGRWRLWSEPGEGHWRTHIEIDETAS